ncbi:MAG TPA: ABC transporter ATP-binding protein [Candidatus Sulfotelmatobacter sp.]|nr:ABC transporter ATP-binding protein [Candidatus Sulfotelmatobacter sp.]
MIGAGVEVERLVKNFGGLRALDGVTLRVEPGERRAIIGPNGAGKTTLFNIITGLLPPTEGRILLEGRDITGLPPHRRAQLGLGRTFQITNLFPKLSVRDNVLLAVQAADPARFTLHRPVEAYPHLFREAEALMERWGLRDRAAAPVRFLSHGEQRQVELLLALAVRPKALLLDEPAAGLSPAETAALAEIIRGLPRQTTILLIEHDMDVAFALADRVSVLHYGGVVAEGTPDAVRRDPQVGAIYLGTAAPHF